MLRQKSSWPLNHLTSNRESLTLPRTQLLESNTTEPDAPPPATGGQLPGQSPAFPGGHELRGYGEPALLRCPHPGDTFHPEPHSRESVGSLTSWTTWVSVSGAWWQMTWGAVTWCMTLKESSLPCFLSALTVDPSTCLKCLSVSFPLSPFSASGEQSDGVWWRRRSISKKHLTRFWNPLIIL